MANPFGGRGSSASRCEEVRAIALAGRAAEIEDLIREVLRCFKVPSDGVVLSLRDANLSELKGREANLLAELDALAEERQLLDGTVRPPATRQRGLMEIVAKQMAVTASRGSLDNHVPAETLPDRVAQLRRAANGTAHDVIGLLVHGAFAVTVVAIEVALFHGGLSITFPPVVGAPEQALSNGLLSAVSLTAVITGLAAFQSAGPKTKGIMTFLSRTAIACFLVGGSLFVGQAIFGSLVESQSAASFEIETADPFGPVAATGLALVLGSAGVLAWCASHYSLGRIREHGQSLTLAIGHRNEAVRIERMTLEIARRLAATCHELDQVREAVATVDETTAVRVSTLAEPAVAAGHALIAQLDLQGEAEPRSLPDELSDELLGYQREELRSLVVELKQSTTPSAIFARIRSAFPTTKGRTR